jgi:hypothetical protein
MAWKTNTWLYVKVHELVWKNLVNQNAQWNGEIYCVPLWQYLAEFFLEWEIFQTNSVEKIKTRDFQ